MTGENNSDCVIGEPFSQEELDEMLNGAVDSEKGVINYKDYAMKLAVDDTES